ncbi:MAG TPA: hypothetical protein VF541_22520 [Longimicrobium sp.]|jgi:hypothetical protein
MLSVVGHRSADQRTKAAAYHVLVLFPADSVTSAATLSTSGDLAFAVSDEVEVWSGGEVTAVRSVASSYDPVRRRVSIGGRRFALSRGNLFLVRYDRQGRQTVTQLPHVVFDPDPFEVSRIYQSLVPGDPVIRDLFHYPPPTQRRAESAGKASARA